MAENPEVFPSKHRTQDLQTIYNFNMVYYCLFDIQSTIAVLMMATILSSIYHYISTQFCSSFLFFQHQKVVVVLSPSTLQ